MRKLFFSLFMLVFASHLMAQTIVGTAPTNRNVILEEFTGRNCGYCPDGHLIANQIMANNPGRFWAINVHAGSFSPTSYPNFQCQDGITIHNASGANSYPTGDINRNTGCVGRNMWGSAVTQRLSQSSPVNVAGLCIINPTTRVANITVEAYYTANGTGSTNRLSVAMLQSNMLGSQSGMTANPSQVINGQYNHTHVLRDIITATFGDPISPVTTGTLITKTYQYTIPENIGNPNGVDVVLEDLEFLTWVAEGDRNIVTANKLITVISTQTGPINPCIVGFEEEEGISCSTEKNATVSIVNAGTTAISSLRFQMSINGTTETIDKTVNIPSMSSVDIEITYNVPAGATEGTISIVQANGQSITPYIYDLEFSSLPVSPTVETSLVNIRIWQDRYGNQTTWELKNSSNTVVASGGPYTILMSNTTVLHEEVVNISSDDCYKFTIFDQVGNGLNAGFGAGHYEITSDNGTVLFSSDGTFTYEESCLLSLEAGSVTNYTVNVSANNASYGTVTGGGQYPANTQVAVTATPNSGYQFDNWTLNGTVVSNSASYTFTLTANTTLVANFSEVVVNYTVNVSANNAAYGTVTGGGQYPANTQVTVNATPNSGYKFDNWTSNSTVVSNSASYTFTLTANTTLVANFSEMEYNVTITVNQPTYGTVTGEGTYAVNSEVTLTATANSGYQFDGWKVDGALVSEESVFTFTITEDVDFDAIFSVYTGISENQNEFRVFPNPAKNTINISNAEKVSSVSIYNNQGQLMMVVTSQFNTIDISTLPKGMYLMKMEVENKYIEQKFLKD